jgi:FkbM family methyltransferase
MNKLSRTPLVSECLNVFQACLGAEVDVVLDIGAQAKTSFLMEAFPKAHHHLFEPARQYHDILQSNYAEAGIAHTLVPMAVSDRDGVMHQHLLSEDGSGRLTHSQLLEHPDPVRFGSRLLEIVATPVVSLDHWARDVPLGQHVVVKIDVDGIESRIIEGGQDTIRRCSLLIVEATLATLVERAALVQALGMQLFDIVGNGYYFDQLQQVDLVFVSRRVVGANLAFRPFEKSGVVVWDQWHSWSR